MITIPDEIKTLLKTGSVQKNFRVHFPNGERADITNENIVSESVSLKESLCSDSTLKFGSFETPSIEFETIGVENIKGCTIECQIEIYCDSSVSGSVYKSDLNHYVYPILYGTFAVDSCKKQSDMSHRQIEAYAFATNETTGNLTPLQDIINKDFYWDSKSLKLSVLSLIKLATVTTKDMSNLTAVSNTSWSITSGDYKLTYYYNFYIELPDLFTDKANSFVLYPSVPIEFLNKCDELWKIMDEECPDFSYAEYKNIFIDQLNNELTFSNSGVDYYYEGNQIPEIVGVNKYFYFPYYTLTDTVSTTQSWFTSPLYYEKMIYTRFILEKNDEVVFDTGDYSSSINLKYYIGDTLMTTGIKFSVAPKTTKKSIKLYGSASGSVTKTVYKYDWSGIFKLDISSMISAYYELEGKFCKIDRDGGTSTFSLKDAFNTASTSESISKSDYSSLWYDDDSSLPFGKVTCTYNNGTENVTAEAYYDGYSSSTDSSTYVSYDISENNIIKSNSFTSTEISNILANTIAEIGGITYMPIELSMNGRPDIECGDFIRIDSDDETIVSFVEQRTLSGVIGLSDDVTSTSEETSSASSLKSLYDSDSCTLTIYT